jgi:hypothetical protein
MTSLKETITTLDGLLSSPRRLTPERSNLYQITLESGSYAHLLCESLGKINRPFYFVARFVKRGPLLPYRPGHVPFKDTISYYRSLFPTSPSYLTVPIPKGFNPYASRLSYASSPSEPIVFPVKAGETTGLIDEMVLQRAAALRAMLLVLSDASSFLPSDLQAVFADCKSQVFAAARLLAGWEESVFVANSKYWKDWPLALFMDPSGQSMPNIPNSWIHPARDFLLGPELNSFLSEITGESPVGNRSLHFRLLFGISQAKKGFRTVPDSFVRSSLEKHRRAMASPPTTSPDLPAFRRFLGLALRGFRLPKISFGSIEPSRHASARTSRLFGGARTEVLSKGNSSLPDLRDLQPELTTTSRELFDLHVARPSYLHSMHWDPRHGLQEERAPLLADPASLEGRLRSPLEGSLGPWIPLIHPDELGPNGLYHPLADHLRVFDPRPPKKSEIIFDSLYPDVDPELERRVIEDASRLLEDPDLPYEESVSPAPILDWMSGMTYFSERDDRADQNTYRVPMSFLRHPYCRVSTVLEPLKVRTITSMDADSTYVSSHVQQSLSKFLMQYPMFHLTGKPLTEDLLHDLISRSEKLFGSAVTLANSGDYASATDRLHRDLTQVCVDYLVSLLDPSDLDLSDHIRRIVEPHVIFYPPESGLQPVLQENGQLMGSVLSFPILCLVNAFSYFDSLPLLIQEKYFSGRLSFRDLPVLINGDDILFFSFPAHLDKWLQCASRLGFELSQGKNFVNSRFATVNSEPIEFVLDSSITVRGLSQAPPGLRLELGLPTLPLFSLNDWSEDAVPVPLRSSHVEILGFMNVGLLTGQAKLSGRSFLGDLPLSDWHRHAVIGALDPHLAHQRFLAYHQRKILRLTTVNLGIKGSRPMTLNLFFDTRLGGLGFTPVPGLPVIADPRQLYLAEFLWNWNLLPFDGQLSDWTLSRTYSLVPDSEKFLTAPSLGFKNEPVLITMAPISAPRLGHQTEFRPPRPIEPSPFAHLEIVTSTESRVLHRLPAGVIRQVISGIQELQSSFPSSDLFRAIRLSIIRRIDPLKDAKLEAPFVVPSPGLSVDPSKYVTFPFRPLLNHFRRPRDIELAARKYVVKDLPDLSMVPYVKGPDPTRGKLEPRWAFWTALRPPNYRSSKVPMISAEIPFPSPESSVSAPLEDWENFVLPESLGLRANAEPFVPESSRMPSSSSFRPGPPVRHRKPVEQLPGFDRSEAALRYSRDPHYLQALALAEASETRKGVPHERVLRPALADYVSHASQHRK